MKIPKRFSLAFHTIDLPTDARPAIPLTILSERNVSAEVSLTIRAGPLEMELRPSGRVPFSAEAPSMCEVDILR